MPKQMRLPSFKASLLTFGSIIAVISFGLFYLKVNLQSLLLICLLIAGFSAWQISRSGFKPIREAMNHGIQRALTAIYIFILIGVLIAAFIQSGTVGTLIYYGLESVSPTIFLPAGLILCSLMSLATGSSWGTAGTAGIILIGMGGPMGIPLPIVAGMVVSGACFGDKMSPVSDTTNLAAMSAEVDLYRHIKSMTYTTGPTYLIVLVAFSLIGIHYAGNTLPLDTIHQMMTGLASAYHINLICLLPLVLMIGLSIARVSAEPAMMLAAIVAVLLAFFEQGESFTIIMNSLLQGHAPQTGMSTLDNLLGSGGIASMMPTLSITLLTLSLGGILHKFGFLHVLMETILKKMKRAASLVTATIISCFIGNMTMGEAYMSILLGGQLFNEAYKEKNIDGSVLSRSLEEGATLTTTLIPWATGGLFFAATLHVPVIDYAPWALLNWINPLLSIAFAFCGIALWRTNNQKKENAMSEKKETEYVCTNTAAAPVEYSEQSLPSQTANSTDPLASIRNLPHHLIQDIPALMVNRQGNTNKAFMVTENFIGHVVPGKNYHLHFDGFKESQTTSMPPLPTPTTPSHNVLQGQWISEVDLTIDDANILGGNGRYLLAGSEQELTIPVAENTPGNLAFYGCHLIKEGNTVSFDCNNNLPVTIVSIDDNYVNEYLLDANQGGGAYLEIHDRPHFHMPLAPESGGYLILGKEDKYGRRLLSAFKIPYGYGIYIAPWTIHSDAYLVGRYMVIYSVTPEFSTVIVRKSTGEPVKIRFETQN